MRLDLPVTPAQPYDINCSISTARKTSVSVLLLHWIIRPYEKAYFLLMFKQRDSAYVLYSGL